MTLPDLPVLLRTLFSKRFSIILLLIIVFALLLYFQIPSFAYDHVLLTISQLLKAKYETGGSIEKIAAGFHKLSLMLISVSIALFLYARFLKWILKKINPDIPPPVILQGSAMLNRMQWIIMGVFTMGAILLRYSHLTRSLWQDEIGVYDLFMRNGILSSIIPKSSAGCQPLMQIIVCLFTDVFGVNEWSLRFPLFLFAILTLPLIYYITWRITASKIQSFIISALLCFHSYHIYYAFQMRGYAMIVFWSMLSSYYLLRMLQSPLQRKARNAYVIATVALVYTHLFSIYFVIAQQIVLILLILKNKLLNRDSVVAYFNTFLTTMLIIILLYIPQLPALAMNVLAENSNAQVHPDYFLQVMAGINYLVAYSDQVFITTITGAIILLLYIIIVKQDIANQILFLSSLLFIILTGLIPVNSGFYPRYLLCALPGFLFITSSVIIELLKRSSLYFKTIAVLLFIGTIALNVSAYRNSYRVIQDYKGAVLFCHQQIKAGGVIAANSLGKTEVKWYDQSIIPLDDKEQLDSLIKKSNDLYVITTYELFAGNGKFTNDKATQAMIEQRLKLVKTFDGEYPVHVWKK